LGSSWYHVLPKHACGKAVQWRDSVHLCSSKYIFEQIKKAIEVPLVVCLNDADGVS